jgi:hypothetical protein
MIYLGTGSFLFVLVLILWIRHEDKKLQAEMDIEKRLQKQYEERVKKERCAYADKIIEKCLNQIES